MKHLPIGLQTFENLIRGDFLYVDKTAWIHRLIEPAQGMYFLSRPRRFGKTLLVTTLKAIFQGKRELFDGLAIADAPHDWAQHPVVHLDLSGKKVDTPDDLATYLRNQTDLIAADYGVELELESYEERFAELIRKLAAINPVAVLIDEYDKPILDNIGRTEQVVGIKDTLSAFYGIIKANDAHLRFVLLTGVTKFAKVSLFSKLNNLNDLSMVAESADMLGYTQAELEASFHEHLNAVADESGLTLAELLDRTAHWYNGYRFSSRNVRVYNPVSTMLMLQHREFKNYWFETGTPTFLLDVMERNDYDVRNVDQLEVQELAFSTFDVENLRVEPLLFQAGYLTIDAYDPETMLYRLGYPNFEVKNAFLQHLIDRFSSVRKEMAASFLNRMIRSLDDGDLDTFFDVLRSFFADIPYDLQIRNEKYYQSIFYLVFTLMGLRIDAEVRTHRGRADAVVETDSTVFIFEFKLYDTKESALAQIKERQYDLKYRGSGKTIHLVGAEFSEEERNVAEWVVETLS